MQHISCAEISKGIFRAYDIRGIVGESITPEIIYTLGKVIGSAAQEQGEQTIITARDGRLSGPILIKALHKGLRESGCDVIDIGQVPSPVLYFATRYLNYRSGVMLTASHNPMNYNGLKIILAGKSLSEGTINELYLRIQTGGFKSGKGSYQQISVTEAYLNRITQNISLARSLRVVLDCGNGVAGRRSRIITPFGL